MNDSHPLPESIAFTHEAMHTTFSLHLRGLDPTYAAGVACACFEKIDLLENHLSRHIETSDIARINTLTAGETLYLNDDCHRCLLLAIDAYSATHGLFDVTLGTHIDHRQSSSTQPPPAITGSLMIHPDTPAVTCITPGRLIDLGGIGKGFALDLAVETLLEMGADDALLTAGASSMRAIGTTSWPIELAGNSQSQTIFLTNQSLSASGTSIQGAHLIHPHGGPLSTATRIWVTAHTATLAEIWSTTLMLISPSDIPAMIAVTHGITSVHADLGSHLECHHCMDSSNPTPVA